LGYKQLNMVNCCDVLLLNGNNRPDRKDNIGALFTDDDDLAEILLAIRTHGGVKRHHHTHVGANGRFDSFNLQLSTLNLQHDL